MVDLRLVLFFTRDVSLRIWDQVGMFEREVALYRRLQERGVEVGFVTYGDASDLDYAGRLPGIRILCNRWRMSAQRYERWLTWLHLPWLWQADVFKTNQTRGADIALRAVRLLRKPLIVRCGYMWSTLAQSRGADRREREIAEAIALERRAFRGADRLVVTTDRMMRYAVSQYGLPPGKIQVIPNYVLVDEFKPQSSQTRNGRRISFIGRLSHEKNPVALFDALEGLDLELIVVGDGPLRGELETKAAQSGLAVRFMGNRPHHELPRHLNSAGLFVLPSRHEGHPKALLEAMACGLPVIGTDVPGIREIIRHRDTGYLCQPTPEAIRAAVQDVLADAELRARMGKSARAFVVEQFALDRVVEMETTLLEAVVK